MDKSDNKLLMFCDCNACEKADKCPYKNRYQRLPRECAPGALGLCPKLKSIRSENQ